MSFSCKICPHLSKIVRPMPPDWNGWGTRTCALLPGTELHDKYVQEEEGFRPPWCPLPSEGLPSL